MTMRKTPTSTPSTPRTRLLPAAVLVGLLLVTGTASGCTGYRHPDPGEVGPTSVDPSAMRQAQPPSVVVASVDAAFPKRPAFGITLPSLTQADLAKVSADTECRPTLVQRFTTVGTGISLKALKETTATPLLSLEPWRAAQGPRQPDFTLKATIEGRWDTQYRQVAQSVVGYRGVVLLRFAHEMNGDWYPWGITNGNTAADFVAAWRHVVDLFRAAGATNVLWVWSPNILRGAMSTSISQFWPGSDYVDIVGLTGYSVREASPETTYRPTLKLVTALTDKPVLLTEVGVESGPTKQQWIAAFGQWLLNNPRVLGFVWFEYNRDSDWRFDDTAGNLAAFKKSLKTARVSC